jgi:hypothetical protein
VTNPLGQSTRNAYNALNDVTHQGEAVAVPYLAKNMDKDISGANRTQKRQASVASEGDEVQLVLPAAANKSVGHGAERAPKLRPFKPERVGHPEKLNQSLGVDVLEWYHSIVHICQQENAKGWASPPIASNLLNIASFGRDVWKTGTDFHACRTETP